MEYTGPLCGWSAVVLSDRKYSSFRDFDSTISIDVIRMKSYMDSLFDPTCVPVREQHLTVGIIMRIEMHQ